MVLEDRVPLRVTCGGSDLPEVFLPPKHLAAVGTERGKRDGGCIDRTAADLVDLGLEHQERVARARDLRQLSVDLAHLVRARVEHARANVKAATLTPPYTGQVLLDGDDIFPALD